MAMVPLTLGALNIGHGKDYRERPTSTTQVGGRLALTTRERSGI